ncbi:MAG TPA: hypothetical protein V6C86_22565 [Oculatellaceae cyanobacterium]
MAKPEATESATPERFTPPERSTAIEPTITAADNRDQVQSATRERETATVKLVNEGTLPQFGLNDASATPTDIFFARAKADLGAAESPSKAPKALTDRDFKFVGDFIERQISKLGSGEIQAAALQAPEFSAPIAQQKLTKIQEDSIDRFVRTLPNAGIAELSDTLSSLQNNPAISDQLKQKLEIYTHRGTDGQPDGGVDGRRANPKLQLGLLEMSIKNGNISDFSTAASEATPEIRQAFLASDGARKIDAAFGGTDPLTGTQRKASGAEYTLVDQRTAREFITNGRISTGEQLRRETGITTDYAGVERALQQQPPGQAAQYAQGSLLREQLAKGELDQAKLTPEQTASLTTYDTLHRELKTAAGTNSVRLAYWDALAKQDGQSNRYLDTVAGEGGRIYNSSFSSVERNSSRSWDKQSYDFYHDPELGAARQANTREVLAHFRDSAKLIEQFDQRVNAPSFEESRKTIATPTLLDNLQAQFAVSATGDVPAPGTGNVLRQIEKGLADDPTLRAQLTNPKSEADKALQAQYRETVSQLIGNDAFKEFYLGAIEQGKPVSAQAWANFDRTERQNERGAFYQDLSRQPQADRERLLRDPGALDQVLGHLDADHRKVAMSVLAHGLHPADELKLAELQGDKTGIAAAIKKGAEGGLKEFKQEYQQTYGTTIESVAQSKLSGTNLAAAERTLAGDQSALAQFRLDVERRQREASPILDWTAEQFRSTTPRNEAAAISVYTAAVGQTGLPETTTKSDAERQAATARIDYRQSHDALDETRAEVVRNELGVALTFAGGVNVGAVKFGQYILGSTLKEAGQAGLRITSAGIANDFIKTGALGELQEQGTATHLRNVFDGAAGYAGGAGTPPGYKLAGLNPFTRPDIGLAPATAKVLADRTNHIIYPFTVNTTIATTGGLLDGKDPGTALTQAIGNAGLPAAAGVFTARNIGGLASNLGGRAEQFYSTPSLSTPFNRGVAGGGVKAALKQTDFKRPTESNRKTSSTEKFPGLFDEFPEP